MRESFIWSKPSLFHFLLLPVACIYYFIVSLRQLLYSKKILPTYIPEIPVITIGNITLGGNGKTPLVRLIALHLIQQGYRPAIILRGYPHSPSNPILVTNSSDHNLVSDEAFMLYLTCNIPVVVCKNRVKSIELLLRLNNCNCIISDDGFQYLKLQSTVSIVTIDCSNLNNFYVLPSGPFRERISRLGKADQVVVHADSKAEVPNYLFPYMNKIALSDSRIISFYETQSKIEIPVADWKLPVRVLVAIAKPFRFIEALNNSSIIVQECFMYKDHESFDISKHFPSKLATVISEKDYYRFDPATFPSNVWVARLHYNVEGKLLTFITNKLRKI
ncbi:MAG: tetraacyldisaccharide 4'-kinase [Methylacidiphilales bacterium]|nr:tetraacyldisaccharide 4'-kinase [Candidatus Methylacidiphilales bacterium]